MKSHRIVFYALAASLFLLSACNLRPDPLPETPVVPLSTATQTALPSATASPSPSPTPTLTPTPSPAPMPMPTPTITPTPRGYYVNNHAGYAFVVPRGWEMLVEEESEVIWYQESTGLVFSAQAYLLEDDPLPFEEQIDILLDPSTGLFVTAEVESTANITLLDGSPAEEVVISGSNAEDFERTLHLVRAHKGLKEYLFIAAADRAAYRSQRARFQSIFDSLTIGSASIYGIDRAQTMVVMGFDPDPEDIDPALAKSSADTYVGLLFSGLVRLSSELSVEPDLAQSWLVSPDGVVYTFTLRSELSFASGKPLTAADVKYSWERAAHPATGSTTVSTYLGDIEGVEEFAAGKVEEISGLRVIDERTLEVTLDGPKPYFLAKLTYPTSFVVDRADLDRKQADWVFSPNASGPFILRQVVEQEALIFERNPAYHTPSTLPALVYLLYRAGPSSSYFGAGEIDLAYLNSTEARAVLEPDHPDHNLLLSSTNMCTSALLFNNTLPPMDDPAVRQALIWSIDKDRLVELLSDNLSIRADSILPPAMPGHNFELPQQPYDPTGAARLLAGSKYAGRMPKIILSMSGTGTSESGFLNALVTMWREALDLEVEVEYLEWMDYTRAARQSKSHIVIYGWCADYPDPENFLDILFHTRSDFNASRYTNPAADALLEEARVEPDPGRRLSLYQQIEKMLLDDYAMLPYLHSVSYVLVSPRIEGFAADAIGVLIYDRLKIR